MSFKKMRKDERIEIGIKLMIKEILEGNKEKNYYKQMENEIIYYIMQNNIMIENEIEIIKSEYKEIYEKADENLERIIRITKREREKNNFKIKEIEVKKNDKKLSMMPIIGILGVIAVALIFIKTNYLEMGTKGESTSTSNMNNVESDNKEKGEHKESIDKLAENIKDKNLNIVFEKIEKNFKNICENVIKIE